MWLSRWIEEQTFPKKLYDTKIVWHKNCMTQKIVTLPLQLLTWRNHNKIFLSEWRNTADHVLLFQDICITGTMFSTNAFAGKKKHFFYQNPYNHILVLNISWQCLRDLISFGLPVLTCSRTSHYGELNYNDPKPVFKT